MTLDSYLEPHNQDVQQGVTGDELLKVKNLEVRFRQHGGEIRAVNGLSFSVSKAKTLAIIGESGSGKTVTSRAIMGLLPRTAEVGGSIALEGTELIGRSEAEMLPIRGREIAMVFQNPDRTLNPTMRVGTQIMEAARKYFKLSRADARDQAIELLRRVGMPDPQRRIYEYPHQLSGGMRQRTMIAAAIACQPRLLIADEATTALDVTTQAQVMDLLLDLQSELGMALVMISHDLGLAASYAEDVLVMYAGQAVEQASTSALFEHVRMPYTRALLDAIPRVDLPARRLLSTIDGQPPDLSVEAVGCSFAPRCPVVQSDCYELTPPFVEDEPGHSLACWHPLKDEDG